MHDPPLFVVMAKAPVCGVVKTRLAREVGAVAAASLARTLCAALLREAAADSRFRTILAVSPAAALHLPFACWRFRHPGMARRDVSGIAKKSTAWSALRLRINAKALSGATITPPRYKAPALTLQRSLPQRRSAGIREYDGGIVRIEQGRGGLGARMQRIFDTCGRGPLIIVGTDIPFVTRDMLARAFRALRGADAVFGPAEDGGYWLVGLRRRPRTLSPFLNVRWSSPHALADTLANLRGRRVAFAETLFDIDALADYRRYQRARYR